jgi:membrane protease YdiL (CAAX protease family)/8-oxo-dGTP pyrophosphatase MutT (NUDIX family)
LDGQAAPAWTRYLAPGGRLHPVWRIAAYSILLLTVEFASEILLGFAYALSSLITGTLSEEGISSLVSGEIPSGLMFGLGLLRLAGTLGLSLVLGRWLDREPAETLALGTRHWARDSLLGAGLGAATMLGTGATMLACGWAVVSSGSADISSFAIEAVALLLLATAEEVAFRGYLQRVLVSWRGPVLGTVVTSILFALYHTLNPNLGPVGLLNIFVAGVVFAIATERSGTLWLATGYHFFWNLTQGPIMGMPVSGTTWRGLLSLETDGAELWTGGPFGPEGGLVVTIVLLLSIPLLWRATRHPASLSTACRRQQAALWRSVGPLPHAHTQLEADQRLYSTLEGAQLRGRTGEVVLVLQRPSGQLLVHTKEFYPAGTQRLPSGGIQQGESVLAAARRELLEETSLSSNEIQPLGLVTYTVRHGRGRLFFHSWIIHARIDGKPVARDADEQIAGYDWIEPAALSQAAANLRDLPAEWNSWGRFRATAHDAAAQWLMPA